MSDDMDLTPRTRIARAEGWLTARVGDELIMMSGSTGRYIGLTETGSRIWELLAEPLALAPLCDALEAEYDAPRDVVEAEVVAFLRDLAAHGAVHLTPAAG
ncbi:MAG: PqqD family peptide modification chaperone [Rhizomicrobium sp.]